MTSLESARYLSLATFRRNGRAVETAVWFAIADDHLYVFSAADAGKVKRLRNSPRARVTPCDVRGRLQGEPRDTQARVVSDPESIKRAYAALRAKYGLQMWLTDFFSRLTGRINSRAIIEIDRP